MKNIAVFCGSSDGRGNVYKDMAKELGREMARRGLGLVYGGGNRGIMGVLAHAVHAEDGYVLGVLPKAMDIPSVTVDYVASEQVVTEDMHERKKVMYEHADAFLALPGGIGTLEELFEVYTWRQLDYHRKNIALLNINGFWDPIIQFLDKSVEEGFVSKEVREVIIVSDDIKEILDRLEKENKVLPSKL